ncbi:hypothetical protein Poli38472_002497 [Pythium oligandrum]|uniref:RING-type domain-containing protein n=1 Tax=Pythium oligandrum TaxID=41045 RepID=A0A8K1FI88_PYTOL|nr:hypothetical protein Poli38472_002497 [Pythium oligandrum]|eukprot:TMW63556.1 hypothetical protein Poli38472_002497 [Pythium oligandrum]
MGNVFSWVTKFICPEEQLLWQMAHASDHTSLREAIAKLTPQTRQYLEWQDTYTGRTPLCEAAAKGSHQCVLALVEAGANCKAKDYKGNTPLHLASKYGRLDVVRCLLQIPHVSPFEVNLSNMTPLDVVRHRRAQHDHDGEDEPGTVVSYEKCIEELEKRAYVYSGWLYEKTENLFSMVSGISNLNSWKRRFCIVLQRGLPDVLELALFAMKPGNARPACPSTVLLYHIPSGIQDVSDSKWFNRKDHTFKLTGAIRRPTTEQKAYTVTDVQQVEFAGVDENGYQMWRSFFLHQQSPYVPTAVPAEISSQPAPVAPRLAPETWNTPAGPTGCDLYSYPGARVMRSSSMGEGSRASLATVTTTLTDDDQEDEDLRRAIELSLKSTRQSQHSPPVAVSAPVWEEDDQAPVNASGIPDESSDELRQRRSGGKGDEAQPAVAYSRAPSFSSIGECIVCFDGPQAAVCVPCGHNAVCMSCAEEILDTTAECPVCRRPIRELIKLYRV